VKHHRIDIFGHQNSLALEPEYWRWLYEIAAKTGVTIKTIIEAIAAIKNPHRSLASEVRVAISAYFHGNPYPIYRCPDQIVPA
jgi:predicted DNA-binding ribbon-helix-helix protein